MKKLILLIYVCFLCWQAPAQVWTKVSPNLTTADVLAVEFRGTDNGWALLADGELLKTSDQGLTWNAIHHFPLLYSSARLTFHDTENGWLVSPDQLYKTTDGGQNWATIQLAVPGFIVDFSFFDNLRGMLAVKDGTTITLLRTEDGGVTFDTAFAPLTDNTIRNMTFLPGNVVYFSTFDTLYRLDTSGNCPCPILVLDDENFSGVHFFNDEEGIVFTYGPDPIRYSTSDGGANWAVDTTSSSVIFEIPFFNQINFHFFDEQHGWYFSGAFPLYGGLVSSGLAFTNDGGLSWTDPKAPDNYLIDIAFASADQMFASGRGGTLLSLSNGQWAEHGSIFRGTALSIQFMNEQKGYIINRDGTMLRTQDGGENFTRTKIPAFAKDVHFFDDERGFVLKTGSCCSNLYYTSDGGDNWESNFWTPGILNDLLFYNLNLGWAIGSYQPAGYLPSVVYGTLDGGVTWSALDTFPNHHLSAVFFKNETEGWLCGNDGLIARTTDGGNHWSVQNTQSNNEITQLVFTPDGTGWASGMDGTLLQKNNNSDTWELIDIDSDHHFTDICFANEETGLLVGDSAVYLTVDGGEHWEWQDLPHYANFTRCTFSDEQTAWVGGDRGTILQLEITSPNAANWKLHPTSIQIAPNPTSQYATLTVPTSGTHELALFNSRGSLIRKWSQWMDGPTTIETSGLSDGLYVLAVTNEGHTALGKMMVTQGR